MNKTEREREELSAPLTEADLIQRAENGWKLVAVEWAREVPIETPAAKETSAKVSELPVTVPFGVQVVPDTARLEESPVEREVLFNLMELMMQEGSYARIAEEINRRGFRTRQGTPWSPVSVFEMLPRLIEVGPHVFQSPEWQKRKSLSEQVR